MILHTRSDIRRSCFGVGYVQVLHTLCGQDDRMPASCPAQSSSQDSATHSPPAPFVYINTSRVAAAIAATDATLLPHQVLHFAPMPQPQTSPLTASPLQRNVFFSLLVAGPSNVNTDAIASATATYSLPATDPSYYITVSSCFG